MQKQKQKPRAKRARLNLLQFENGGIILLQRAKPSNRRPYRRCRNAVTESLRKHDGLATNDPGVAVFDRKPGPQRSIQFTCYARLGCVFASADNCNEENISKCPSPRVTGLHTLPVFVSLSSAIFVYSSLLATYLSGALSRPRCARACEVTRKRVRENGVLNWVIYK